MVAIVSEPARFDLVIIGGGINGAGIARDAAGRGLRVALCEQHDLASATSSASSKLIHGGLRYLEHYEFRLVAEALAEREILLRIAPHIVRPLTFVLPWVDGMRPRWLLRLGLWLYDHLARRSALPGAHAVDLSSSAFGAGLNADFKHGFTYSDCWVDDTRLVILNCRSALQHGATVLVGTRVTSARREADGWRVSIGTARGSCELRARALVNAAGPWTRRVLSDVVAQQPAHNIRLVKGSHIVTAPLYEGDHAFILQNDDGRVVLVIPFQGKYSLIGTTDIPHTADPARAVISSDEITYLCKAVNRYFKRKISFADVLWSFSGVRPLYDDGSANPAEVTRDYKLVVDDDGGAPLLSIYGGKITTYRCLAEHVMRDLSPWFMGLRPAWTANEKLPGGDITASASEYSATLAAAYPFAAKPLIDALVGRHGSVAGDILTRALPGNDLGECFGPDLYAAEVDHFMENEWAHCADDVLWRRTKAGLVVDDKAQQALARYMARRAVVH
jgi:glycerol-3-phosphate dehydrogenase